MFEGKKIDEFYKSNPDASIQDALHQTKTP